MSAQQFIAAARELKGARWKHRGRKPWAVDCIGLVVMAAREAGIQTPDEAHYGREPWDDRLRKGCRNRWGEPLAPARARAGDVALIRWAPGDPTHVGIVANHPDGGLTLIHAHNLHGVIEQSLREPIARCVVEVYRTFPES
jgi:hypothetical protein